VRAPQSISISLSLILVCPPTSYRQQDRLRRNLSNFRKLHTGKEQKWVQTEIFLTQETGLCIVAVSVFPEYDSKNNSSQSDFLIKIPLLLFLNSESHFLKHLKQCLIHKNLKECCVLSYLFDKYNLYIFMVYNMMVCFIHIFITAYSFYNVWGLTVMLPYVYVMHFHHIRILPFPHPVFFLIPPTPALLFYLSCYFYMGFVMTSSFMHVMYFDQVLPALPSPSPLPPPKLSPIYVLVHFLRVFMTLISF
jgi:hypothetical protein